MSLFLAVLVMVGQASEPPEDLRDTREARRHLVLVAVNYQKERWLAERIARKPSGINQHVLANRPTGAGVARFPEADTAQAPEPPVRRSPAALLSVSSAPGRPLEPKYAWRPR